MAKRDGSSEVTPKDAVESQKLMKDLIKEFNKDSEKSGKMAWCLGTDSDNPTDVKEFISTGSTLLDYAIANRRGGGLPVGKITEISGEEASGKSLLCAHLIVDCQRRGGIAVYIDTENAANPDFLQRIGVNINELVYLQPGCCEDVGEAIIKTITMARSKAPNKLILVLWDGIAATPTRKELTGDFDLSMDLQLEKSKVLSKMMRMITDTIGKDRVCLVFTNQLKVKIGVMYGDPMTTPGGKAVPYHASVRLRCFAGKKKKATNGKETESEEGAGDVYGVHTSVKVAKNRLGPPFRKVEFDILFASGIDNEGSWFQRLHECDEILKKEGWCYLSSLPSGKIETKGAYEGKDLGISFREKEFGGMVREDPKLREHVLNLLEKHMIVKYNEIPKDADLNPESLMDAETVQEGVLNGTV